MWDTKMPSTVGFYRDWLIFQSSTLWLNSQLYEQKYKMSAADLPSLAQQLQANELFSTAAVLHTSLIYLLQRMIGPLIFNEAFVFWQLETNQQPEYSCVPTQASCWQAWRAHHWLEADGWRWSSSRPLWWPQVLPGAECCCCWYQ